MATSSKRSDHKVEENEEIARLRFRGPAGQVLDSFQDLSKSSLNEYLPEWTDFSSYIIPHVFTYKQANHSDEDFDREVEIRPRSQLVIDRRSDDAEYLVYEALSNLVRDRFRAPFIAVHNLNIDKIKSKLMKVFNLKDDLGQIFKDCIREYDYVIIGPKVGLLAIEVKHSYFIAKKDFSTNNAYLPNYYEKAILQLNSFDSFVKVLGRCTKSVWPEKMPVRKILFTPNLDKKRYNDWLCNLPDRERNRVRSKVGRIVQWFAEDSKPDLLVQKLMEFLQCPFMVDVSPACSYQIYELYAPIIVGLSSLVINKREEHHIKLNTPLISIPESIQGVSSSIQCQDFLGGLQVPEGYKLIRDEAIILTPDQLAVLRSPCRRQLILGAAGTGKTIILQQKALQLMRDGQSVLVLGSLATLPLYPKFFLAHGERNYMPWSWSDAIWKLYMHYLIEIGKDPFIGLKQKEQRISDQKNKRPEEICALFEKYDAIIVDDALDVRAGPFWDSFMPMLAVLAIARKLIVWIGIDSYLGVLLQRSPIESWLCPHPQGQVCNRSYCSVVLRQVMRCPQYVYSHTYNLEDHINNMPDAFRPVLGHKVIGHWITNISKRCKYYQNAVEEIKREFFAQMDELAVQKVHGSSIAIVFDDHRLFNEIYNKTPFTRFSFLKDTNYRTWRDVSSLEWPVVVFLYVEKCCARTTLLERKAVYYQVCSRATAKIIEISVTFDIEDEEDQSAPKK